MAGSGDGWDPRLSVHALSSRRWSLGEDLELYDRLRVRRISVSLPKLVEMGLDDAVGEITRRELRVDGIYAGCAFDLGDPSAWPAVQDTMVTAVETGARLGADTLQTTGGTAGGRPFEWATEQFAAALAPVAPAARRGGMRIAIEPTRPQFAHVGFVHTLRDALALAAQTDLWLLLDTAHLWWEPGFAALLTDAAPRCAAVQMAALGFAGPVLERAVPGDGRLPLGAVMGDLVSAGFAGPFELEIIGQSIDDEGYESAVRRSLRHLDGLLGDLHA